MANEVQHWCRRVSQNVRGVGRLICLVGPNGCGKTQMLLGARNYVNAVRMSVYPRAWKQRPATVVKVRWSEFAKSVGDGNEAMREDVELADVAFLDDVGSESDQYRSGEPSELLGDVLSALANKFVFITTNFPPDAWRQRWDGRVEDRLLRGESVVVDGYELGMKSYARWKLSK